jgi:hypothetical protein
VKTAQLSSVALLVSLSAGIVGCAKQEHVQAASSAGQRTYALGYVDSLTAARTEMATLESQVETAGGDFAHYPDALTKPSWPDVGVVYQDADLAGKSSDYVQDLEREKVVAQFYIEEKDELNRRVGGAAQYAAKQKQCDVELSGPTSYALGKGIDERIRDRMREHNEGYLYIDDHEDVLGKRNRPKLEEQSDAIAQTSYFVYVAAPQLKERLQRQVSESSDVDKTLERVGEDAHKLSTNDKASAALRAKATAREQAAIAARQRIAGEVTESKKLIAEMDKRLAALRDKYEAAFKALRKDVEQRADAK